MNDFVCALTHVTSTFLRGNVRQRTEPGLTAPGVPWLHTRKRGRSLVLNPRPDFSAAAFWPAIDEEQLAWPEHGRAAGEAGEVVRERGGARQGRTILSRAASLRANGRFQTGMGEQSCGREAALPVCAVMKSGCRRQPGPGQRPRKCREPCCRHSLRVPGRSIFPPATP